MRFMSITEVRATAHSAQQEVKVSAEDKDKSSMSIAKCASASLKGLPHESASGKSITTAKMLQVSEIELFHGLQFLLRSWLVPKFEPRAACTIFNHQEELKK